MITGKDLPGERMLNFAMLVTVCSSILTFVGMALWVWLSNPVGLYLIPIGIMCFLLSILLTIRVRRSVVAKLAEFGLHISSDGRIEPAEDSDQSDKSH